LQPGDIAAVEQIGNALCKAFVALDDELGAQHMEFIQGTMLKTLADKMAEVSPKLAEVEAAAMADAAKAFEVNPDQDPPAEEPHELKRPAVEAQMVGVFEVVFVLFEWSGRCVVQSTSSFGLVDSYLELHIFLLDCVVNASALLFLSLPLPYSHWRSPILIPPLFFPIPIPYDLMFLSSSPSSRQCSRSF
jgi:hypothetical protein